MLLAWKSTVTLAPSCKRGENVMNRKTRKILDWVELVSVLGATGWGAYAIWESLWAPALVCGALIAAGLAVKNYKF